MASTLAHNGSAILFAAESRRHPSSPWLLLSVSRRAQGAFAVVLNSLAWALEVAALTFVSLTLTRLVNVAGLALVLLLSRKLLHERVGPREISGVLVIALGTLAALTASAGPGSTTPSPPLWLLILVLSLPLVLLPVLLRAAGVSSGPALAGVVARFAYALGGVLNKGLAYGLFSAARPLLVVGVAVVALRQRARRGPALLRPRPRARPLGPPSRPETGRLGRVHRSPAKPGGYLATRKRVARQAPRVSTLP